MEGDIEIKRGQEFVTARFLSERPDPTEPP